MRGKPDHTHAQPLAFVRLSIKVGKLLILVRSNHARIQNVFTAPRAPHDQHKIVQTARTPQQTTRTTRVRATSLSIERLLQDE